MSKPTLRLFLDEGVPRAVGKLFQDHGHTVINLQDSIARGSSDLLVCAAAEANNAILVAIDGDMKQIAQEYGLSGSRFRKLSLIKLSCKEVQAASRVEQFLDLILAEWKHSEEKTSRRLFVDIGGSRITIYR